MSEPYTCPRCGKTTEPKEGNENDAGTVEYVCTNENCPVNNPRVEE